MRLRRLVAGLAVLALVPAATRPAAHAQSRRPMSLLDIAELPRVLDPQLSPDGRFVVYAQSHADWKLNRPVWQLWRQEIGRGPAIQLTFTEAGVIPAFTRWSPDGRSIAFV